MTTYAIAVLNNNGIAGFDPTGGGRGFSAYVISYALSVQVDGGPTQVREVSAYIPVALSAKKDDAAFRKFMADDLLTFLGITIDPDDIYIPFAGR